MTLGGEKPSGQMDGGAPPLGPKPLWKFLLRGIRLIVAVVLIAFLFWCFGLRSVGTISVMEPAKVDEESHGVTRFEGKYVTFSLSERFVSKEFSEPATLPVLERKLFSEGSIQAKKLTLVVQDNSGYAFEEYSSYRIRETDPKTYIKQTAEWNGVKWTIFTKQSQVFEVAAFSQQGANVVSLVLSSPLRLDGLEEELETILGTLHTRGN